LRFTAKTYLFGPIPQSSTGVIKKATIDYMSGVENKKREMRYVVTPRASKDYDNDQTTLLSATIDENTKYIDVDDATAISDGTRIYIDSEQMFVTSKTNNKLVVIRGYENSVQTGHIQGTSVNLVTTSDDALIDPDDDFGFSESLEFLQDFKEYSPSLNQDI